MQNLLDTGVVSAIKDVWNAKVCVYMYIKTELVQGIY